jgi:hypothetical protein
VKGWGWEDIEPYFAKYQGFNETISAEDLRQADFSFDTVESWLERSNQNQLSNILLHVRDGVP